MIKRETIKPLSKDEIIDLFVVFSKLICETQEDMRYLTEENQRLKQQNCRNSSGSPSHDFDRPPKQKELRNPSKKKTGGQPGHKGTTPNHY
jgi:hypothetical protein